MSRENCTRPLHRSLRYANVTVEDCDRHRVHRGQGRPQWRRMPPPSSRRQLRRHRSRLQRPLRRAPARGRGTPAPTRDPQTPGYVAATMLADGAVPPADASGNFVIGPTHTPAPEMTAQPGVPQGTIHNFTMESTDSKIYPGIARAPGIACHGRSERSGEADRQQRSCALHAPRRGVRPAAVCARHDRAGHRRRGWPGSDALHGAGQPDRAEARARR